MKHMKQYPDQITLRKMFVYDAGFLRNLQDRSNTFKGEITGCNGLVYRIVSVNGITYMEHRLIYIYHNNDIPDGLYVDHIDGNPLNNKIENLQLLTNKENSRKQKIRINNTSGFKGVTFKKDRKTKPWRSYIYIDGKFKHLGYFDTPEEAAMRYNEETIELFGIENVILNDILPWQRV